MAGRRRNRKTMQPGVGGCRRLFTHQEEEAERAGGGRDPGEAEKRKKVFMPMSPTDVLLGKRPKEVLPAGAPEKRMKVVRRRLPRSLVEHIVANPYQMPVVPADALAKETNYYRKFYAKSRRTADRIAAYQQGIIDQYKSFGYAEEDTEVTDDDDDD